MQQNNMTGMWRKEEYKWSMSWNGMSVASRVQESKSPRVQESRIREWEGVTKSVAKSLRVDQDCSKTKSQDQESKSGPRVFRLFTGAKWSMACVFASPFGPKPGRLECLAETSRSCQCTSRSSYRCQVVDGADRVRWVLQLLGQSAQARRHCSTATKGAF